MFIPLSPDVRQEKWWSHDLCPQAHLAKFGRKNSHVAVAYLHNLNFSVLTLSSSTKIRFTFQRNIIRHNKIIEIPIIIIIAEIKNFVGQDSILITDSTISVLWSYLVSNTQSVLKAHQICTALANYFVVSPPHSSKSNLNIYWSKLWTQVASELF